MQKMKTNWIVRWMIPVLFVLALIMAPWTVSVADDGPSEKEVAQPTYFIDEGDGGDNPWRAGCHWHYRDKVCSAAKMFFSGDYCDGKLLYEWTNQSCHEVENDKKRYNCAEECERKGSAGTCVVRRDHCGRGMDSAVCECSEESN